MISIACWAKKYENFSFRSHVLLEWLHTFQNGASSVWLLTSAFWKLPCRKRCANRVEKWEFRVYWRRRGCLLFSFIVSLCHGECLQQVFLLTTSWLSQIHCAKYVSLLQWFWTLTYTICIYFLFIMYTLQTFYCLVIDNLKRWCFLLSPHTHLGGTW